MISLKIQIEKPFSLKYSEEKGYEVVEGNDFIIKKFTPNIRLSINAETTSILATLHPEGVQNLDNVLIRAMNVHAMNCAKLKYSVKKAPSHWYIEETIDFENVTEEEFNIVSLEVEHFNTLFRDRQDLDDSE